MDRRHHTGLLWVIKWAVIVMLATLVWDCLYVMWPYPDGAVGLDAFQAGIRDEWALLVRISDLRFPRVAYAIHDGLHTALFKWPGFDYMITRAQDPTPLGAGEMMRRAVLATDTFWGTATAGLQLFSARLAVLVLSMPLVLMASIGVTADGLIPWYLRRTGGGRESGFVYHRAKRHAAHVWLALCFVYLVPPLAIDPRIAVTAFSLAVAVAIRIAVSNFKKYL